MQLCNLTAAVQVQHGNSEVTVRIHIHGPLKGLAWLLGRLSLVRYAVSASSSWTDSS